MSCLQRNLMWFEASPTTVDLWMLEINDLIIVTWFESSDQCEVEDQDNGADCSVEWQAHLSYEAVELLLGLEPLDLLVDSLVFLQLLQICPATVEVRTETEETQRH